MRRSPVAALAFLQLCDEPADTARAEGNCVLYSTFSQTSTLAVAVYATVTLYGAAQPKTAPSLKAAPQSESQK